MTRGLVSVIIPACNEAGNIASVVRDVLKLRAEYPLEVIVVDDGSRDQTSMAAKEAGADRVITYATNKGKGHAIRAGIEQAQGDYIVQIDADHQFQPYEIPRFIEALNRGYDVVCGTRFDRGDVERGSVGKLNLFGNWLMSAITTFFSGITVTDIMAGFKAFTREAACSLNLVTAHFGYEAEIIVKAGKLNLAVSEVPITYTKREVGSSSVRPIRDGLRVSYTIAKMYFTFPGPSLGEGPVGRRILWVLVPLWLALVLPMLSYVASRPSPSGAVIEMQYVVALLLFVTTRHLSGSRLAALVASAFLAITPLMSPPNRFQDFSIAAATLFLTAAVGLTGLFLQESVGIFVGRTLVLGLLLNLGLMMLYRDSRMAVNWPLLNLAVLGFPLAACFWNHEMRFARSIVIASGGLVVAALWTAGLLSAIAPALFLGIFAAGMCLETISFRRDKSPLFSPRRLLRAGVLAVVLACVFLLRLAGRM